MRAPLRPALSLLLLLLSLSAAAGEVEEAEVQRLSVELRDRVAETRWEAADAMYRRLVAVEGARPAYQDHWRGYLAARSLGDAIAQAARLQAAAELDATEEVVTAEAMLMAWYGRVDIRVSKRLDPRPPLVMSQVPFEADQRRVLEAATAALAEEGRYVGLLPLGMYNLGSSSFDIVGEDAPVRVRIGR